MTGKRQRSRPAASKGKSSAEATHLADKAGKLHENVTVFEPLHGPNTADRMDIVEDPDAEPKPMKENAVPQSRRVDEGQNRGAE